MSSVYVTERETTMHSSRPTVCMCSSVCPCVRHRSKVGKTPAAFLQFLPAPPLTRRKRAGMEILRKKERAKLVMWHILRLRFNPHPTKKKKDLHSLHPLSSSLLFPSLCHVALQKPGHSAASSCSCRGWSLVNTDLEHSDGSTDSFLCLTLTYTNKVYIYAEMQQYSSPVLDCILDNYT